VTNERKIMWAVVLVAVGLVAWFRSQVYSQPEKPVPPTLVFVTGGTGPYWQATIEGAQAAARSLQAKLLVESPEKQENLEDQQEILRKIDKTKVDGLAVSPLDAEQQVELIDQLCEGLRVVTFDSDAPKSKRLSHVGTSNFSAGRMCARLVSEAIPDGGEIAVFLANATKENLIDRKGGFQERISQLADDVEEGQEAPKYKIVGFLEDNGSDEKCVANLVQVLKEHPKVNCLVTLNARQGPVVLAHLEQVGKLEQVQIITFDTNEATLAAIESGRVYATIAQDPYRFGYEAVRTLIELCHGEDRYLPIVGRGAVYVGAEPIRKDNLEDFRNRQRKRAAPVPIARTAD
jgi:ribose transport system substrate-binding protein